MMLGFMGQKEAAEVAARAAFDVRKRKRLRKLLRNRQLNKGEHDTAHVSRPEAGIL